MNGVQSFADYLPWLGLAFGFLCLIAALRDGKRKRLIDNLPTSKTTGVFIGLVELKGSAESSQSLTSYLAEAACVLYSWTVEEHWSRTVTETYTDSQGKTQTRTRTESGWKTVADGGEMIPFYLRDDCGCILVHPDGAKIEPLTMFEETCGRGDSLYYAKGPDWSVSDSDHRRRFKEVGIPLHHSLYLMGQARERSDIVAPEIAEDKDAPMFLISTRTEEQVSSGFGWAFWGWLILGFALFVGGFALQDNTGHQTQEPRVVLYALVGAGYLVGYLFGWTWMVYNSMVDLRQRVRQAWAQVDIQLQRRSDLVPNLVNVVKGFRDYEANLQTELAELRGQLAATPPGVVGPDYKAVNGIVAAMVERFPQLKSNELFSNLQENLVETEQRIALARGYFNEIATFYNTRLERVPDRYVAELGAMKLQALMMANEFQRAAVEVNLQTA
jgi:hypothetical protein